MTPTIEIQVNGAPQQVSGGSTVQDLLRQLGVEAARVAVERNREILPRASYSLPLQDRDEIEIVTFVGGG